MLWQWKHISLDTSEIGLIQALINIRSLSLLKDRKENNFCYSSRTNCSLISMENSTKIRISKIWCIIQTPEQYVFTYIDTKGNVNSPLHADYLNNKMKSVERRHKILGMPPHMLRHTELL